MTTNDSVEGKTCVERVWNRDGFDHYSCGKKAWKLEIAPSGSPDPLRPLCRIHHPEAKAERAAKRGPTQEDRLYQSRQAAYDKAAKYDALRERHEKAIAALRTLTDIVRAHYRNIFAEELAAADAVLKQEGEVT